jgi:hypothetical protein
MVRRYVPLFAASFFVASVWTPVSAAAQPPQQPDVAAFTARINRLCTFMGLEPSTAPFASCVVVLKYWTDASSAAGVRLITPEPPPPAPATYTGAYAFFRSPPPEQHQRELAACAGLGIAPETSFVHQCASAVDAYLEHYNEIGAD